MIFVLFLLDNRHVFEHFGTLVEYLLLFCKFRSLPKLNRVFALYNVMSCNFIYMGLRVTMSAKQTSSIFFYLIVQGFHRTYATGAACQQRTLTPSGHLVLSHLGFVFVHQTETTLPTCDAYRIWPIYRNLHYRIGKVSTEYLQRVWHASRGRWLLRTPGPVPLWDLHVF